MKKLYLFSLIASLLLLAACSKDFLKSYDDRIIGTWHIDDVNRNGIGGNTSGLPFLEGTFTFYENGSLEYQDGTGIFSGSWDISKRWDDDHSIREFRVNVVNFSTQEIRHEYYDEMRFTGTNHFKAIIHSGFHSYVTHFRR